MRLFSKSIEMYIQKNYKRLESNLVKNKLIGSFERLICHHLQEYFLSKAAVIEPFQDPNTSDYCWELDDCILNIDAKTVDLSGNAGDKDDISVLPNQMTVGSVKYTKHIGNHTFSGVHFIPGQPDYTNNKPHLTFILKGVYTDDLNSFKFNEIKLFCVVSKASYDFYNDCIGININDAFQNYKTYSYITSSDTYFGQKYSPKKDKDHSWVPFTLQKSLVHRPTLRSVS